MRNLLILSLASLPALALADAADLMAITNPAVVDARPTLRATATGFAADDFVPAHRIAETWRDAPTPRPGRNLAVGFGRAEVSQSYGGWTFGTFKRVDALGEGSRDTVRIYAAFDDPDSLLAQSGHYKLNYRFKGYSADGLRFAWAGAMSERLTVGVAVNLLKAGTLRVESVSGSAVSGGGVATVNGRRELLYTGLDYTSPDRADLNDFAPATREQTDNGWGRAIDLGLQWRPRDDLRVSAALTDLFGQLRWNNVPQLTQDFNNASWPLQFNSPSAVAKITGTNRYQDYTLQLKPKAAAAVEWSQPGWSVGAGLAATRGLILPEANASWGRADGLLLRVSYEPRFKSAGAAVHYGPFYASLRTDRSNLNDARAVGATAGLAIRF